MRYPAATILAWLLLIPFSAQAAPAPGSASPLVFVIPPVENVDVMYERFLPVKDHLTLALDRPVTLRIASTYEEAIESIGSGQAQLAYLDPAAYCEAHSRAAVAPLVQTIAEGSSTARSVIVARSDSSIARIIDGRGKRLALGSARSSSSSLIPAVMFREVGIDLRHFRAVDYLEQEDRIALSVLARRHDLGGMSEDVARKYLGDGLRVVKISEPVPQYVICSSPRLTAADRATLMKALLSFRAPRLQDAAGIARFAPVEDRDFDVVRVMIRNLTGRNYLEYRENAVRVAILPLYSAITLFERFDPLMRYLSRKTGREFKLVIPKDFEDFFSVIESGGAEFSYSNPYIYIQLANRERIAAFANTVTEDSGDIFRGIIITHKDSSIRAPADLKGRNVMVVSYRSAGGFLAQKLLLSESGIDVFRDLKLREGKRQEEVILNVYRRTADAGFVRESALDVLKDEIDLSRIRIVAMTPYIPNWPFAATGKADAELVRLVAQGLLELRDPAVLSAARVRGFKPAHNTDFDDLRKWIERYER